jgi:ParB family chromosome partitioning protein
MSRGSPTTTLRTPAGTPARSASSARASGEGGLLGRLDDHRATGGERRGCLAGDHRGREVPRRDRRADADRLTHHDHPPGGLGGVEDLAADPLGLLTEPLDERRGVADLSERLGQRLSLLEHDETCEILRVLSHELEPAPKDRGPILAGARAPRRQRPIGSLDCSAGLFATGGG